ncbi:FkbM family methyltransferase [Arcticibacter eurypsychrophilus]|uniref:FkbM family methyltransferase n=1 Tax=Arcticibacter eurypsychrophilus TaxID=1434752 RepID=UPI001481342B|nr:FkbM family methyltransferase [Arcticibacter eurypsychrophilus]
MLDKLIYKVTCRIASYKGKKDAETVRNTILTYFSANPPTDPEYQQAVEHLKVHPLAVFSGSFSNRYNYQDIEVFKDPSNSLSFVNHQGHRLYFKRSYNTTTIKMLYNGLLKEQDPDSPHRYTNDQFSLKQGDILFDVGSAEGIFPLSNIEQIGKVILFERDPEWSEALQATFAQWNNKVQIISKFVSDKNDSDNISIDTFLAEKAIVPHFVKIDVEGVEDQVLKGMDQTIRKYHPKIALCTYHQQGDFKRFSVELAEKKYKIESTKGLMYFLSKDKNETPQPPFFRKALIRATPLVV